METEPSNTPFHFNLSWPVRKPGLESADLGSRTRKRYRDNRPDEREIHETTLQKLFSAQRHLPDPIISTSPPPPCVQPQPVQKSTLHAFWNIRAPPVEPPPTLVSSLSQGTWDGTRCEECDAPLRNEIDGDVDMCMEIGNSSVASQWACAECGKSVCATCSVVGEKRCCLQCATAGRRAGW
ncbi:hypothetical protein M011DRAFT_410084 [Sporormia fimetaria CBS 119925]|uniref:Uncharacterized protein n=1 Tax=Sporormia fimetaria CBS 119925 TaxID=1340428 RepID=A0A6A6V2X8_9PLEO|nr:hypothetical protein M011DRAFT_410084 [Sporormia fimetaria CBS 119925]